MPTYLLAWNPHRWQWNDLSEFVDSFRRGEVKTDRWSCGRNKHIAAGDSVWLIRLGKDPRGIFAHGTVVTPSYEDEHWDDHTRTTQYIVYQIDSIVDPETEPIIPRSRLDEEPFASMHWDTQMSGVQIPDNVAMALHQEWLRDIEGDGFALPEEIPRTHTYYEGAQRLVTINAYERNAHAREACIAEYGTQCVVCGFSFEETYGSTAAGHIHVHHLVPLSEIGETYELDPVEDLRPVCPNCHAVIHRRVPAFDIDEVKRMIRV